MKLLQTHSKGIVIGLWTTQGLLAALFLSGAAMKLFMPADKLAAIWPWTAENRKLVIVTGVLDALVSLGLILPGLLGVFPQLTFYTALGAIVLMVSAIVFHVSRNEAAQIGINVFVLLAAIFIAWGRVSCLRG